MSINIFLFTVMVIGVLALIKGENAFQNQMIIVDAIYKYQSDKLNSWNYYDDPVIKYEVNYYDMRSYTSTVLRFWDWGCTHIVPPDKFILIEPYIR